MGTFCKPSPPETENARSVVFYLCVDAAHAGRRIDNFLLSRLRPLPRPALHRLLRRGEIRVNGGRVRADYRLVSQDRIRIPPLRQGRAAAPERPVVPLGSDILYEDSKLLVVDKRAGVAVHGGSGLSTDLRRQARHDRDRPLELVHRLDRDTSGCLLLCSDPQLLSFLHGCFRRGEVVKTYLALVQGQPGTRLEICFPLHRVKGRQGGVVADAVGRTAHSQLRVIQRYAGAALVQLRPRTGRTHQLRAHSVAVGHPIAGDRRYGDREFNRGLRRLGLHRLFLHARTLGVPLPDGGWLHLKAPLPVALRRVLVALPPAEQG